MIFYSPYIGAEMLRSYKWMDWDGIGLGWEWDGLNLCVGLLYEHRFAVLMIVWDKSILSKIIYLSTNCISVHHLVLSWNTPYKLQDPTDWTLDWTSAVLTHEFGHTLGASHDDAFYNEQSRPSLIMWSSVYQNASKWSEQARKAINEYDKSCLQRHTL